MSPDSSPHLLAPQTTTRALMEPSSKRGYREADQNHRQGPSVTAGQPLPVNPLVQSHAKTTLTVIFHRFH
jgi:hypothetical protein